MREAARLLGCLPDSPGNTARVHRRRRPSGCRWRRCSRDSHTPSGGSKEENQQSRGRQSRPARWNSFSTRIIFQQMLSLHFIYFFCYQRGRSPVRTLLHSTFAKKKKKSEKQQKLGRGKGNSLRISENSNIFPLTASFKGMKTSLAAWWRKQSKK